MNCVYGANSTCFFSELPGSIELHQNSIVQKRAAELELQHEVNLQTKKEKRERLSC